jgi:hypothetical protein
MDKWYEIVGNLRDDSEDSYMTQQFVYQVYRELVSSKIKDKGKFRNRMGPEFEQWSGHLSTEYPESLVIEILNDDEFWLETLEVTHLR